MLRYTALVGLTLLPFAAASAAPPMVHGEQDGYKFEYRTQLIGGGKVVIAGRVLNPSEGFTFTVEPNGEVHGDVGGTPVDFRISSKEHDGLLAEVFNDGGVAVADAGSGAH